MYFQLFLAPCLYILLDLGAHSQAPVMFLDNSFRRCNFLHIVLSGGPMHAPAASLLPSFAFRTI